ncbi:glycosyltransferase family 39 protein [Candidatus Saccharibacteria bacterium TM7i]|nr:glycosyltransferase family 39 protein [Candidatus Saccharibacteria bacterium TM7i]
MKTRMSMFKMVEKYWYVAVFVVAALFFWLTMALSFGQPIWFDEGYSILLAKHSTAELLSLTAVDAHPPLYYLLLKVWSGVFGWGEYAIRSLSAFLMSVAVVVAALTLRKMFSTKVMLVAIPFILVAPFLLRYGYEVRMYALATLIAVSATYILVRIQSDKRWQWWIPYSVLVALGMYTLYMTVAVWVAHFVWLLVVSIKSKQRPFWRWPWLYAFAGAVVFFLPYIKTFLYQLTHSALPGMGNEMTIPQLTNIVSTLSLYTPEWNLGGWGTIVIVIMLVGLSLLGISVYRGLDKNKKRSFMLITALSVIPILFYGLISLPPRDPVFIVRYMAHSAIFIYMLAGAIVALSLLKGGKGAIKVRTVIFSAGVLVVLLGGVYILQKTGNFNFERMQLPLTTAVHREARCDNDETVVVADDPYTYIDSAYYFTDCQLFFYSKDEIAYKGGYAMLHRSDRRVSSPADVATPVVVHLGWKGQESAFKPDTRYTLVETITFDKQVMSRYKLNAE